MKQIKAIGNKWFFLFFLSIILIILIVVTIISIINRYNNRILVGQKVGKGIYKYVINNDLTIENTSTSKDGIIYLTNDDGIYSLEELNIYTNKSRKLGSIKSDFCSLDHNYVECSKDDEITIYDTSLKKIYSSKENYSFVPYKGSFLIVKEKDIFYNGKKIRTIKDEIERFDILNYYVTKDNTYISFISINDLYIYNVKDDKYKKIDYDNIHPYDSGFYYFDFDVIIADDFKKKIYDSKYELDINNIEHSTIKDNIFFGIEKNYLEVYNLNSKKLQYLDYKFVSNIDKMLADEKYVYIIYEKSNPELYVINIEELDSKWYSLDEYREVQFSRIDKRISDIEKKYNNYINIIYKGKDVYIYDDWYEEVTKEDNYEIINEALDALENVLNKFGVDFFSTFKHDDYKGLKIAIAKEIIPDDSAAVKYINGQFFLNDDYYNVFVVKSEEPFERSLCHEFMHAIDYNADNHKYNIDNNWYDYNPKNFEYDVKNYLNYNTKYTPSEHNVNNVYFVDSYSKVNQDEDRARTFENVCYVGEENIIHKYPNLLKKAKYIKEELIKNYPVLKDSSLFDGIE